MAVSTANKLLEIGDMIPGIAGKSLWHDPGRTFVKELTATEAKNGRTDQGTIILHVLGSNTSQFSNVSVTP